MDPRKSVALDVLEGDSPLGIHTLPEYTTGVAGKRIPTPTGSPWPLPKHLALAVRALGTRGGDASETTRSQERARRRVKDTPNGLTARLSPNCCLAKTAYRRSRRVSCSYGTFLEHPISAKVGKWLPPNRSATSNRQKIGARGYGDLLFRHSPCRISRYELPRCLAG
jgi:hypothetical protein